MYTFFVIIHVFVSIFLILVVLLQKGKGADMGSAFGGSSSTMFGVRGQTTFIHKLTAGMALLFMVLSVVLATLSSRGLSDLQQDETPVPAKEAGMSAPANEPPTQDEPADAEAIPSDPQKTTQDRPSSDEKPVETDTDSEEPKE